MNRLGDTTDNSPSESSPLLSNDHDIPESYAAPKTGPNFYRCIFSQPNFIGGVYCIFMFGLIGATFNATIPLHVREAFQWGGIETGLVFGALQAPRLICSPLVGWLKDRVGTQIPTAFGLAMLAPSLWLLGIPGSEKFQFTNEEYWGPRLYVLAMILIGFHLTFLNGAGTIEATGELFVMHLVLETMAIY